MRTVILILEYSRLSDISGAIVIPRLLMSMHFSNYVTGSMITSRRPISSPKGKPTKTPELHSHGIATLPEIT